MDRGNQSIDSSTLWVHQMGMLDTYGGVYLAIRDLSKNMRDMRDGKPCSSKQFQRLDQESILHIKHVRFWESESRRAYRASYTTIHFSYSARHSSSTL